MARVDVISAYLFVFHTLSFIYSLFLFFKKKDGYDDNAWKSAKLSFKKFGI